MDGGRCPAYSSVIQAADWRAAVAMKRRRGSRFGEMTAIFISHSSADRVAAEDMKRWLEAQGHTSLFLDFDVESGIKAGADWEQTLYQKLRQCQAVIALLTPGLDRLQMVLCRAGAGARAWQGDLFGQGRSPATRARSSAISSTSTSPPSQRRAIGG